MRTTLGPALRSTAGFARLLRLVHRFAEFHRDLRQRFGLGLDLVDIVAADDILQGLDGAFYRFALSGRHLVTRFLQGALSGVDQRVGLVLGLDQFAPLLVLGGVRLGVL